MTQLLKALSLALTQQLMKGALLAQGILNETHAIDVECSFQ